MSKAIIVICVVVILFVVFSFLNTDDSDKSFFKRSGFSIYTDYKTGLQYIGHSSMFGGGSMIPRLDENGKHMKVDKQ